MAALSPEQLVHDAGLSVGDRLNYAGLILLGTVAAVARHIAHAEVILEYRTSEGSTAFQHRVEFRRGFFGYYDELWGAVNARNDQQSYQDGLFRLELLTLDEAVVREAILNAVTHRDYRHAGSVFVRQFPRLLEIVSPGGFPAGINAENVLDRQFPRNRRIAEVAALCGLVERSGQGMNRMFEQSIRQSKQVPDFSGTDAYQVSVRLHGEVRNPAFVRFLERVGRDRLDTFSTRDFLVLDYVGRGEAIPDGFKDRLGRLLDLGVIEKMGRRCILSRSLYAHLGQRGVYTRRKGLDHETNKALLLRHIMDNQSDGSPLADLVQVLPQLGERKVQSLLAELRTEGKIWLRGQRRWARWYATRATPQEPMSIPH